MSDPHYHTSSTKYVPYTKNVEIKEHKAPTDEAIRILNEFEEKARRNIIAKISVDESILKGCVLYFIENANVMGNEIAIFVKFNLNGKDFEFKEIIKGDPCFLYSSNNDTLDSRGLYYDDTIQRLAKVFSEKILEQLINSSRKFQ